MLFVCVFGGVFWCLGGCVCVSVCFWWCVCGVGLGWVGLGWVGLGWVGLGWGVGWGLGWVGLGCGLGVGVGLGWAQHAWASHRGS